MHMGTGGSFGVTISEVGRRKSRKRFIVERIRRNFGPPGHIRYVHKYFDLIHVNVILGWSVHFLKLGRNSKAAYHRVKRMKTCVLEVHVDAYMCG